MTAVAQTSTQINTTIQRSSSDASGAITGFAGGSAASGVDFNTFLRLLTTQLKNQDPLNPLDGTQFTGQIAQFSALEQQINSNAYLKKLSEARDFSIQGIATSYLGKETLVSGNRLVKNGTTADFGFKLEKAASRVEVEIVNASGQTVRTVDAAGGAAGSYKLTWDGKTTEGENAPNGTYTLRIRAQDAEGNRVQAGLLTYGLVREITTQNGKVGLVLADGRTANFEDATGVREPAN